jgi:hypothetical protein
MPRERLRPPGATRWRTPFASGCCRTLSTVHQPASASVRGFQASNAVGWIITLAVLLHWAPDVFTVRIC